MVLFLDRMILLLDEMIYRYDQTIRDQRTSPPSSDRISCCKGYFPDAVVATTAQYYDNFNYLVRFCRVASEIDIQVLNIVQNRYQGSTQVETTNVNNGDLSGIGMNNT